MTVRVVAAKKGSEVLNVCVGKIYVYSCPDPTLEFSHIHCLIEIICIRFCLSHAAYFERHSGVYCLVSALKSYFWRRINIQICCFCSSFREHSLPQILCYVCFDCDRICLTYPDAGTHSGVKHAYSNKRVVLVTYLLTDYWSVPELWPYK